MAYELILSTDTLNQGRIKINNFVNNTSSLFSTGTFSNSTLRVNSNLSSTGDFSFSVGSYNNIIGNDYSSILGGSGNTINSGNFSIISGGKINKTNGSYSSVLNGYKNESGNFCTILGGKNNSSKDSNYSVVLGGINNNFGSGYGQKSLVGGFTNIVSALAPNFCTYSAAIWGKKNIVRGNYSFIGGGYSNQITFGSNNSIIGGGRKNLIVGAAYATILGGRGNRVAHRGAIAFGGGAATSGTFSIVLGNNDIDTPSVNNVVFKVDNTGRIYSDASTSITQPADYAEYFEWLDQNPNFEDRKGLFVSLEGEKIVIGNSDIIGIVSATPAFVGDTADLFWKDLKLKNEWGQYFYENFSAYTIKNSTEIVYINQKNEIFQELPSGDHIKGIKKENIKIDDINLENFQYIFKSHIYNQNFDSNMEYTPRSERKEWDPIGLLGKLLVRTSEKITSNKVDAGPDGKAKNGSKYHVLKTVKDFDGDYGIVQILFK